MMQTHKNAKGIIDSITANWPEDQKKRAQEELKKSGTTEIKRALKAWDNLSNYMSTEHDNDLLDDASYELASQDLDAIYQLLKKKLEESEFN